MFGLENILLAAVSSRIDLFGSKKITKNRDIIVRIGFPQGDFRGPIVPLINGVDDPEQLVTLYRPLKDLLYISLLCMAGTAGIASSRCDSE